jgi:hypothetical protein
LSLPPLPTRRYRVGGNVVVQTPFGGAETRAEVFPSQGGGYELIKTGLDEPFHELALRRKGARRSDSALPVVTCLQTSTDELPADLQVKWDSSRELEG